MSLEPVQGQNELAGVSERLPKSADDYAAFQFANGEQAGRKWAKLIAKPHQLEELEEWIRMGFGDRPEVVWPRISPSLFERNIGAEEAELWSADEYDAITSDYLRGFAEGALEIYRKVRSQI